MLKIDFIVTIRQRCCLFQTQDSVYWYIYTHIYTFSLFLAYKCIQHIHVRSYMCLFIHHDTQENKSDDGSEQPTKSDGIPGNESTNGSDGSALFSLYVLISILGNTSEELHTTIISDRIPIVGADQIRWKILY